MAATRPIAVSVPERIEAHVLLCWLAQLLVRVVVQETGQGWGRVGDEMDALHRVDLVAKDGHSQIVTKPTPEQRKILRERGFTPPWRPARSVDPDGQKAASADVTKSALGLHSPLRTEEARKLAAKALRLARRAGKLQEAADLMEEAINNCADLPTEYAYKLRLWRRGIM